MPKVIDKINVQEKPYNVDPGMFFKTHIGSIYMVVRANGGLFLIGLDNGIEWDDCDLSDMTVKEVEGDNDMTLLNVQSITIQ